MPEESPSSVTPLDLDKSAFPVSEDVTTYWEGLLKSEYYAGHAMQALLSKCEVPETDEEIDILTSKAFKIGIAMSLKAWELAVERAYEDA